MRSFFKYIFISIFFLINACENREWDNPFDPGCPKEIFTPINFTATQEGDQVILSWNPTNPLITGFKIERQVENESFSAIASPGKDEHSATNEISEGGKLHTYKLYALAGSNKSNEVTATITPVLQATITTKAVTGITATSAISGGTITDDNGGPVTARGVVWSTASNPTLENNEGKTQNGSGTGSFTSELTELNADTEYFVRAYATNSMGTAYGNEVNFGTSELISGTFTDSRDNNVYKWVKIGEQIWMAENLAYLPAVSPPSEGSDTLSYYYVYGYNGTDVNAAKSTNNYATYGVLYNWPATLEACPEGWHLPSDNEWEQLAVFISTDNGGYHRSSISWETVGKHLKATYGWINNGSGTDDYGFSLLPGGGRNYPLGNFDKVGQTVSLWSSTEFNNTDVWDRYLWNDDTRFYFYYHNKNNGMSVRCVKD
jgi:uncharacterized protein (TIGR02145 family)